MTNPLVGIIYERDRHPAAKRLADLTDPETAALVLCDERVPLDEALERTWDNDAHLILYRLDADKQGDEFAFARVSKRSPFVAQLEQAGGRVRVPILVFDFDLPKLPDGVTKQEWSEESLGEFMDHLDGALSDNLPEPSAFYTTLHGARIIYVLDEEVTQLDAEAMCRGLIGAFAAHAIELDSQCTDWTRLFRLPRTVRQDSGAAYEPDVLVTDGPLLAVADCPRAEALPGADKFAEVDPYQGSMPDPDEVRALLEVEGKSGKKLDSDLVKKARTYLEGRRAFDVVFKNAPIAEGDQGWNNQVTKIIGQTVGMLARQDEVTPEGVYALLHSALEQLQHREDQGAKQTNWYEIAWSLVCRMWANEEAQIIAERQEREAKIAEAHEHRAKLIEQVKIARPDDVPDEPAAAEEWFMRRLIASDGRRHHVMNRSGNYNTRSIPDALLIPMVRELDMEEVIPATEIRGKNIVQRSATAIINDHATPITAIECSAREDVAYIDGPAGHKVLHIPVHRLNPKLTEGGLYDKRVDQWLQALGGSKYPQLIEWLSHALDVRRAICALNLYGSPGTGKGMLASGLSECFEGEQRNDGRALGKFNVGLLDSPIVNCDEGVPKISSDEALTIDQAFRSLVTGGRVTMRAMHRDPFNADIYPRILFTSNDRDIIRSIVGHRDLTPDDIAAIELRLLSIEVGDAAQALLTSKGNYSYTAGWVAGQHRSQYILANHLLFLFNHRMKAQVGTGRLLVEGETSTNLVREMRLRSRGAQIVLRALVKMLESPSSRRGMHIHDDRVWVTPAGLVDFAETSMTQLQPGDLTLPVAGRVLRQFTLEDTTDQKINMTNPPGTTREQRARWFEIELGILYEEGLRYGLSMERIYKLLNAQVDGPDKIAAIEATLPQEK